MFFVTIEAAVFINSIPLEINSKNRQLSKITAFSEMTFSQFSVFLLTFIVFGALVVFVKRNRHLHNDVTVYSIGDKNFISDNEEADLDKMLHLEQVTQKIKHEKELMVIEVPFPHNVSQQTFVSNLIKYFFEIT